MRFTGFEVLGPIPEEGSINPVPFNSAEYFGLVLSNSRDITPSNVLTIQSFM